MRIRQFQPFRVSAPGRICLFGEHSDYLGLDVIAAAIDMTIDIVATPREDNEIRITYKDLAESDSFSLGSELEYRNKRDYVRSAFNVMTRKSIIPTQGVNLKISGNIPIAAGVLFLFFNIIPSAIIAAAAMSFSAVSVIGNALRLKRVKI